VLELVGKCCDDGISSKLKFGLDLLDHILGFILKRILPEKQRETWILAPTCRRSRNKKTTVIKRSSIMNSIDFS